jgi:quercetin dioxygenase-like cupin family protein
MVILKTLKHTFLLRIIEYVAECGFDKNDYQKATGNVSAMSFDSNEGLTEKTSPFDSFAQIIDGKAEIIIDGQSIQLSTGQGIIIPAHRSNIIKAKERFKMILTVI